MWGCLCGTTENGVTVVISNHDSPDTRLLYANARIHAIEVARKVAAKAKSRGVAQEIVAVYRPVNSESRKLVQLNDLYSAKAVAGVMPIFLLA